MRESLGAIAAVFRRDLRIALTQPLGLVLRAFNAIVAISGVFFFARLIDVERFAKLDHRVANYFAYVTVNMAFTSLQATALLAAARSVRDDQVQGTLEPILATQRHALLYVAACGLWPLALGAFEVIVSLSTASLLGLDLRATNLPSLVAFLVLGVLMMNATGVLTAAAVIAFKRLPPSGYLIGGAAAFLAGTLFPVTLLPLPLRIASWCLPLTHALRGFRGATAGESLGVLWPDALWLAVASLALAPVAAAALAAAAERGRRDGTLAHY
jgi:ABC-2 type transport system permease protein